MLQISFASQSLPKRDALFLTVADKKALGTLGIQLDGDLGGALTKAIASSRFTGAKEQSLTVMAPASSPLTRIVLVGIGDASKASVEDFARIGGSAFAALGGNDKRAVFVFDTHKGLGLNAGDAAAHVAFGARLRSYRFDKYHTKLKPEQLPALSALTVAVKDTARAKKTYLDLGAVADGIFFTRDLVSEPPNVIYPESLAAQCRSLQKLGVQVDVLEEKQLKKMGMGALVGVAMGSDASGRLVTMSWKGNPGAKDKRPVALVGKGVTFDTGGYSLKPPGGMERMKYDMAGAGAVIGAMMALAGRKAKANVVGVVGLVENMVSGHAMRPSDVVTTMSGQTVEVLNTDAEGRLVLADALWYTQEKFKPRCIVDLATLTGAMVVALGHEYAGIFSNDDRLAEQLTAAGGHVSELLWRFPLSDAYDKDIDSPIADMKNIGSAGEAGSITAAQFIKRFIQKDVAWAHLDIAGMAWENKGKSLTPKGASAYGVRLLDRFVRDSAEGK